MYPILAAFFISFGVGTLYSQDRSSVWRSDQGNGTFRNPIIHADYSDPDAIRVGEDYYMVSSSFHHAPAIPILQSNDLVNWNLIGHALKNQTPYEHFQQVRPGGGVWAPSIRYHQNEFFIYYPDPDFGIYQIRSKSIYGPWSDPVLVLKGKGLIDPCPLWDEDGRVYLANAYAGSRAGIKSILAVRELNKEGTKPIGDPVLVYDGHMQDPTIEGPKLYKRNGWYYLFAPAGGVSKGWQTVLRARSVYGPYERRVVLQQGTTNINGPHQGAWIETSLGEHWFLHFQDKGAYGRVLHLQPMKWVNDWPVIGADPDGDGIGEPVASHQKPNTKFQHPIRSVIDSDEFDQTQLGLQWQWQANPSEGWGYSMANGHYRLFSVYRNDTINNLSLHPAILSQKFPAERFMATVKLNFSPRLEREQVGLLVNGTSHASISIVRTGKSNSIFFSDYRPEGKPEREYIDTLGHTNAATIYLRVCVDSNAVCRFGYSEDGNRFTYYNRLYTSTPGKWVGATLGLYCVRDQVTNDGGYADIDWFRIEPFPTNISNSNKK